MPFQIIRNDITKVKADAIVNTANPKPQVGRGTDGAIYEAAGWDELLAERQKIGALEQGTVAETPAFNLKAKYIIHTVGPAWHGGEQGELEILHKCYKNSLELAHKLDCKSIAFPLIATGVYGFPKDQALQIAMSEISAFLMRDDVDMTVKLVVFDDTAFRLSKNLFLQVESFISDVMYGAIIGDIVGSRFEFDRGPWTKDFELFTKKCSYTDDSVMTIAVLKQETILLIGKK